LFIEQELFLPVYYVIKDSLMMLKDYFTILKIVKQMANYENVIESLIRQCFKILLFIYAGIYCASRIVSNAEEILQVYSDA